MTDYNLVPAGGPSTELDTKSCFCDRYCQCAWCCYLGFLLVPVLSLLFLLGWGAFLLLP